MAEEHGWLDKILSCLKDSEIEAKKRECEIKKGKDPRVIRKRTSSVDLTQQSKRSKKTFRYDVFTIFYIESYRPL